MNKFWFLYLHGLKKRIVSKAFLISNIIVFILTLFLAALPKIINQPEKVKNIVVYADKNIEKLDKLIISSISKKDIYSVSGNKVNILNEEFDKDKLSNQLLESKNDMIIYFYNCDNPKDLNYKLITKKEISQTKIKQFTDHIKNIKLDYQEINNQAISFQPEIISLDKNSQSRTITLITTIIISLPITFLIIFVSQLIGTDIIEEKESKSIETILASVSINKHFMSKVLYVITFLAVQGTLFLIYGLIGYFLFAQQSLNAVSAQTQSIANIMSGINFSLGIVYSFLFLIIGALMYLVIAATIASISNTNEEFQNFYGVITITLIIPIYITMYLLGDSKHDLVLTILSYIPILSTIMAPAAFSAGVISLIDISISLLISITTLVLVYFVLRPVYKNSILSYTKGSFITKIKIGFRKNGK